MSRLYAVVSRHGGQSETFDMSNRSVDCANLSWAEHWAMVYAELDSSRYEATDVDFYDGASYMKGYCRHPETGFFVRADYVY